MFRGRSFRREPLRHRVALTTILERGNIPKEVIMTNPAQHTVERPAP